MSQELHLAATVVAVRLGMKRAGRDPGASVGCLPGSTDPLSISCCFLPGYSLPSSVDDGAIPVFLLESSLPVLNICLFCLSQSWLELFKCNASGSHGTIPIFIIVSLGQLQPLFQSNFILEIVNVF